VLRLKKRFMDKILEDKERENSSLGGITNKA
jgi:hypothetical protein